MVIKKKQIIVSTLVMALGVAVFLNWYFTNSGNAADLTDSLSASKNLGDSQYVDSTDEYNGDDALDVLSQNTTATTETTTQDSDDAIADASENAYFVTARLERQQAHDEALEIYQNVIDNTSLGEEEKKAAVEGSAQLAANIKLETDIETLIKAKGFEDVIVIIDSSKVSVVILAEELTSSQSVQIKEIILKTVSVNLENISIIPTKS